MKVKLIRDKLPPRDGAEVRPVNSIPGKQLALIAKLHEETEEIADDATNPEEYADLFTAMLELARINGVDFDSIEAAFHKKYKEKGGFRKGMIMVRDMPIPELVSRRIVGQVKVGDVLQDRVGMEWKVVDVRRVGHESNPHITVLSKTLGKKTIWQNTIRAGNSRWRRIEV